MTDYNYEDTILALVENAVDFVPCTYLCLKPKDKNRCIVMMNDHRTVTVHLLNTKPKPKTRIVNIIEVPAPLSNAEIGDHVHTFSILTEDSTVSVIYQDSDADRLALKKGLFFASAEDVIKNIDAINANN